LGYGSDAMDVTGGCSMQLTGESYISINISSRSSFVSTATKFGTTPTSAGYICEKESEYKEEKGSKMNTCV
jgi:hypothetical protein